MWNKKKSKQLEIQEQSGIKYTGNVTIQRIKNGKIVQEYRQHNAGTKYLFEFILKSLWGNYYNNLRPYWITPWLSNTDKSENVIYRYVSSSIRPILSTSVFTLSDNNSYIEYKFYLPYRNEYLSTGFDTILLYNSANKPETIDDGWEVDESYSMIVNLQQDGKQSKITVQEDEDILIIWQLNLRN